LVEVVGPLKNLPRLLEADTAARIFPQPLALPRIEVEAHMYNSYTLSCKIASEKPEVDEPGRSIRE
jgi:hypothetical protein